MHGGGRVRAANEASEDILRSIRAGVTYLWGQTGLRFLFMAMAMINFFFTGPLLVGIPVLADQRLPEGAAAFGLLMSAYAGGNLAGFVVGGLLPKPSGRFLGALLVGSLFSFGLVLVCFGWITNTWIDLALILLVGIGNGYLGLVIFTWIQQRTPREMLGRVMSMVMFAGLGLVPLSQILAGAVSSWDLTGLFVLSGSVIVLAALWSVFQPALKSLAIEMAGD
jgi:MFS family permease